MKFEISNYFRRLLDHNRKFIIKEVLEVRGLAHLLLKQRRTGEYWTKEEKKEIRIHLKNIAKAVPIVVIFLFPGGTLLLPFLAEVLDKTEA